MDFSHRRWSTWCVGLLARARAAWHESCCKNISLHKAFVRCLKVKMGMLARQNPWGGNGGLRGTEASLIFLNFRSITCGEVVKFNSWVRFVFLFNKTFARFNAHCVSVAHFLAPFPFCVLWAESNLSCCSLALQLRVERFTSRCEVFLHWNSFLEVFETNKNLLGFTSQRVLLNPRVIRRFFSVFFSRKSQKSQKRLFYTKKSQKKASSVLFNLCIHAHTQINIPPQKIQQKIQPLILRFDFPRLRSQSTGAAFSPTCRAFICSTDDYFTEIDEDGGGSRGCVWVLQGEPLIFKYYLEILVAKQPNRCGIWWCFW